MPAKTTNFTIKRAVRTAAPVRIAMSGPSGSGKTMSALKTACALAASKPVVEGRANVLLIDSERGSSAKYGAICDFDVLELPDFSPVTYVQAVGYAASLGYPVIIIDSASHAWAQTLVIKDEIAAKQARSGNNNQFAPWAEITPLLQSFTDAITTYPGDVIVTFRSKSQYAEEVVNGKKRMKKIGTEPQFRGGDEILYEFDIAFECLRGEKGSVVLTVDKTRLDNLPLDFDFVNPANQIAEIIDEWRSTGVPQELDDEREQMFRTANTIGMQVYGQDWARKQVDLTTRISVNRTGTMRSLTNDELQKMISGMIERAERDGITVNQPLQFEAE